MSDRARAFPAGIAPTVLLAAGQGWLITREGDSRVAGAIVVYTWDGVDIAHARETWRTSLPPASPAFPNISLVDGLLWIAYHDGAALQIRNLSSGHSRTVAGLSNPSAFHAGWFAYCEPTVPYRVHRLDLRSGTDDVVRLGAPTGLSRILDDGSVVTVDEDRLVLAGTTIPCFAADLAVGEGPQGGTVWQLAGPPPVRGLLWSGLDGFTPKCAADGDRVAICTWGSGDVRLFCGTRAELPPAPPVVPPVVTPPPPIVVPPSHPDPLPQEPPPVPDHAPLRADRYWFGPNLRSAFLLDLFDRDVLGPVQVFQFYAQQLQSLVDVVGSENTYENLVARDAFRKLRQLGIPVAWEQGAFKEWDPDGTKNLDVLRLCHARIVEAGGIPYAVVMDEPLTANKDYVHLPVERVAAVVATFILAARDLGVRVVWTEAYPHIDLVTQRRFRTLLDKAGALPNFRHLDIDHKAWSGPAEMEADVRAVIEDFAMPTGIILAGYPHVTDADYKADVIAWAREVQGYGLPLEHVIVQSWQPRTGGVTDLPQNYEHIDLLNKVAEIFG